METRSKTQSVDKEPTESPPVALLTVVLRYDDLLIEDRRVFTILRRPGDEVRVGRGTGAPSLTKGMLGLPDKRISATHLILRRLPAPPGGGINLGFTDFLEDPLPGSKNGTFLNGHPVAPGLQVALNDGDVIEVGYTLLCYRRSNEALAVRLTESDVMGVDLGPTRTLCPAVVRCIDDLARLAPTELRVLIAGESGVGKESAASFLHGKSHRTDGPWIAVNCAAIPDGLFESAFFGHTRGAFTHAVARADGHLTEAHGGTLFLDEVGSLAADHQAKLLRVIETGVFRRVGSDRDEHANIRWLAATNEDVTTRMRSDLVFRLREHESLLPPLRERREDLGALLAEALAELRHERVRVSITPLAARRLFCAPYPGNIRQFRATVRAAATLAGIREGVVMITPEHLPADIDTSTSQAGTSAGAPPPPKNSDPAVSPKEPLSAEALKHALEGRTKVTAARSLGISVRHLDRLLAKYRLIEAYRQR